MLKHVIGAAFKVNSHSLQASVDVARVLLSIVQAVPQALAVKRMTPSGLEAYSKANSEVAP